jgi:hypothetical protein
MKKKSIIIAISAFFLICKGQAQNTFPTGAGTFAGIGTTTPAAPLSIKLTTQPANPPAFIQYLNELNEVLYEQRFQMGTMSGVTGGPAASMYLGNSAGQFANVSGGANYNTIIGSYAAGNLTTAGWNTGLGTRVFRDVTTGSFNTAVGERAMQKLTTGEDNIGIGEVALAAITTASRNIAIGTGTMATNASGDNNTVIGSYAGKIGTYSGSVILGYRAASLADPGSNKLWIQNSNAAIPLIYGDFSTGNLGFGTTTPENSEGWDKTVEIKGNQHAKFLVSSVAGEITTGMWSHSLGFFGAPAGGITGTWTNHPFSFITNKQERMTITKEGSVGIGTWAPSSLLDVNGVINGSDLQVNNSFASINTSVPGAQKGNIHLANKLTAYNSGNSITFGAINQADRAQAGIYTTSSNTGIKMYFGTSDDYATGAKTRMTLDEYGNVGIGKITPDANAKLDVAGNIYSSGKVRIGDFTLPGSVLPGSDYSLAVNGSALFTKAVVKLNVNWPDYVFSKNYELPTLANVERYITENSHLPGVASAQEVEKSGIDLGDNQAVLLKKVEELTLYMIDMDKKMQQVQKENAEMKAENKNIKLELENLKAKQN